MRRFTIPSFLAAFLAVILAAGPVRAVEVDVSLRGSPNSMLRQNEVAREAGLEFVGKPAEVDSLVDRGVLVPLKGNRHYAVNNGVSYPYARPEVRLFIERLAEQYYKGTGERLVVTSLLRPTAEQPRNAHQLSVHPTGIAIDFRISQNRQARAWLESVLLRLERQGLLDITRERWPPHYHVALFPDTYRSYLVDLVGEEQVAEALRFEEREPEVQPLFVPTPQPAASKGVVSDGKARWTVFLAAMPLLLVLLAMLTLWQRDQEDGA